MSKEDAYKYEDYVDEYAGIPELERSCCGKPSKRLMEADCCTEFSFDTEQCPTHDK